MVLLGFSEKSLFSTMKYYNINLEVTLNSSSDIIFFNRRDLKNEVITWK